MEIPHVPGQHQGLDRPAGSQDDGDQPLLVIVLAVWRWNTGSLSVTNVKSRKAESFYWTAILVSNTLGTALGDFLADSSGLGFAGGAAVIAAALALIILAHYLTPLSKVALFWATLILGTLSHLTFIMVFVSLVVFSGYCEFRTDAPLRDKINRLVQLYGVPGVFVMAFYFYYARNMAGGGGNINEKWTEINRGFAYLLGLPGSTIKLNCANGETTLDLTILAIIIQLIFLEGVLSIDNAAVLGTMVTPLSSTLPIPWPRVLRPLGKVLDPLLGKQRMAALKVGLLGAYRACFILR